MNFFKRFFNKKSTQTIGNKEIVLNHDYTDSFGNKWYSPSDLTDYPFIRINQINVFGRYAELKINNENLLKFTASIKEAIKEGDTETAIIMLNQIEMAEQLYCETETLLNLACSMFLLNDEKANSFNMSIHNEKINILKNDADAMAFFLPVAYSTLRYFKKNSQLQVVEYLQKTTAIVNQLQYYINYFLKK